MCTKKVNRYFTLLLVVSSLSFFWISCNQSSSSDGAEATAATDTSIIGTLEMRPPGSIIPKERANEWVKAYRNAGGGPFSTKSVIHHPDAVKYYMDSIFNKYTPQVALPDSHVWRVAFTPMFNLKQQGGPKFSFCIVPCIVDTGSSKKVYEFFTEMQGNTPFYNSYYLKLYDLINPVTLNGTNTDSTRGFVFNEGQLWP